MSRNLSEFTGLYQVSHTLKFALNPIGKTEGNLQKSGLLEQDFKRAKDYPEVKKFLDDQHKKFLQKVLSCITDMGLSFLPLESFEVTVTKEGDKGFFLSLL